jgi:hypothetical protein
MIRLGLRLTLGGGKESLLRLVVTALAVAVGVAMLLATLATSNAIGRQNMRGAWLSTTPQSVNAGSQAARQAAGPTLTRPGALWWLVNTDQFKNALIVRVDVAATGPEAPVPPGIPRLPGPGQFYASPALVTLLGSTPASELGNRFEGTDIGTVDPSALSSPDDLVIVIGHRASAMAKVPGAGVITGFATSSSDGGPTTLGSIGLQVVLAVLALVLLFPVLVFIGTATRLSAARREQRFAAIRLVGATFRQVAVIAAVEAAVAALAGIALGFALFFAVLPVLPRIPFTGQPFESGDFSIGLADSLVVALGVPLAAIIAARVALRRVRISPLGVDRRVTPSAPSALRVIPLLAGICELAYFVGVGHPKSAGGQIQAYLLGFFVIMTGLVIAGPWLMMVGSKVMARHARRVPLLIAGRRLADNPRGAFCSIRGLILALFVTSVSVGVIATLLADHGSTSTDSPASRTVIYQFAMFQQVSSVPSVPSSVLRALNGVQGVTGVTLVYTAPASLSTDGPIPDINGLGGDLQFGVVSCAELAKVPALGRCQPGATLAAIGDDLGFMPVTKSVSLAAVTTWPGAHLAKPIEELPVTMAAVATDGSGTAIARVETILDAAYPFVGSASLFGQLSSQDFQLLSDLQTTSEVAIVASLLIAGCSLAVAMVSGVTERKRPFGLLRLAGVPPVVLRRVVAFETAAPLVIIALGSAVIGLVASDLFLRSQLGITLRMPAAGYYGLVFGGLIASLAIIGSTLPLIEPITRPENTRME